MVGHKFGVGHLAFQFGGQISRPQSRSFLRCPLARCLILCSLLPPNVSQPNGRSTNPPPPPPVEFFFWRGVRFGGSGGGLRLCQNKASAGRFRRCVGPQVWGSRTSPLHSSTGYFCCHSERRLWQWQCGALGADFCCSAASCPKGSGSGICLVGVLRDGGGRVGVLDLLGGWVLKFHPPRPPPRH